MQEVDPAKRAEIYKEFNQQFYDLVPGLILYRVNGRRYFPRYESGYYYNVMTSGDVPYYDIRKK